MKIAIGCDHAACEMKDTIITYLKSKNIEIWDCGTVKDQTVDYPDIAEKVCDIVTSGQCDCGILMCGTGIGISIAANKVPGIRCALCNDPVAAKLTREHNNANVLAMGARIIGIEMALHIVKEFINTPFSDEERHARRISKIHKIESKHNNKK